VREREDRLLEKGGVLWFLVLKERGLWVLSGVWLREKELETMWRRERT
jgi:hypothetical protein